MIRKDASDNTLTPNEHDQVLAEIDENHRVFLCEYGVVHLVWGEDMLPYCPGDFVGVLFLVSSLKAECERQCLRGEKCGRVEDDSSPVYLQYGSLRLSLAPDECRRLQAMVQEAVRRLYELRRAGCFQIQKEDWSGPPTTDTEPDRSQPG